MDIPNTCMTTFMAYTNATFNHKRIFESFVTGDYEYIDSKSKRGAERKKKKSIKLKYVTAKKGTIVHLRYGKEMKGLPCKISKHGKGEFPNQVSMYLSIGPKVVHFMVFNKSIKIANCKNLSEVKEALCTFWELVKSGNGTLTETSNSPYFIIDVVLCNVVFYVDFVIDRKVIDKVSKLPEYKQYIDHKNCSIYEPTSASLVKIPFKDDKPTARTFFKLILDTQTLTTVYDNPLQPKKDKENVDHATFLVFGTGKINQSTRIHTSIEKFQKIFMKMITDHKDEIKLSIK